MRIEKRASFGWPATAAGSASPRLGIAVHFDGSNQGLASRGHAACRTYWKDTRRFHMGPDRGWLDIGYSFGCCPHGVIFEGRGLSHQQAAQPGGNSTWYSCTFMSGPAEQPTAVQLAAWREFRSWLRGMGVAAALRGHRDFVSTDCPGSILYRMVRDGSLATKEADMALSAQETFDAVWKTDRLPAPTGAAAGNPTWQPQSYLSDIDGRCRELQGELAEVKAELTNTRGVLTQLVTLLTPPDPES